MKGCRGADRARHEGIVTGASRGIGRALCEALASRGARLGLMARGRERLEELAATLPEGHGGPHVPLVADVSKRAQVARAVDRFAKRAEGLDLVVANAGVAHYGPFVGHRDRAGGRDGPRQRARHDLHGRGRASTPSGPRPWTHRDHVVGRGHSRLSLGCGIRRHEGGRPGVCGGASARAVGNRRLGDDRFPRRGGDRPPRPRAKPATRLAPKRGRAASHGGRRAVVDGVEADSRAVYAPGVVRLLG